MPEVTWRTFNETEVEACGPDAPHLGLWADEASALRYLIGVQESYLSNIASARAVGIERFAQEEADARRKLAILRPKLRAVSEKDGADA